MLVADAMVSYFAGVNNGRKEEEDIKRLRKLRVELSSASLEELGK